MEANLEMQDGPSTQFAEPPNPPKAAKTVVAVSRDCMNRGQIVARGSVTAKFIKNATVIAEEDILVSDVVLHSHLSAGKRIKVGGKRGQIVGGVAIVGVEISVKSVRALVGTVTDIQVGINPKVREEYYALRKEIKSTEVSLNQISK